MNVPDARRRSVGEFTTAALAWLLLLVAVLGPLAVGVFGWDSVTWGWLAVPVGGLLLVVAFQLWSYRHDDRRTRKALEIASWLFPAVSRFKETVDANFERVRENAQLINDMRGVVRSYRLGDVDEALADEFASERDELGIKVRKLGPSDVAEFLAVQIDAKNDWGEGLALCIETVHADQFHRSLPQPEPVGEPTTPGESQIPSALDDRDPSEQPSPAPRTPAVDNSLLARLVVNHPLVATVDAEYDEARVRTILQKLPRYDLDRLIDELRTREAGLVSNMASVLKTYGLGELEKADSAEIESSISGGSFDLPSVCAQQFVDRLELDQPAWMLELFYRDTYRRTTERLWSEHREDVAELAPVLLDSDLPFARRARLDTETLIEILTAMATFDTSLVTLVDLRLGELEALATHYAQHLEETQGIEAAVVPGQITELVKDRLPVNTADLWRLRDTSVDLDVLRCLGRSWIAPYVEVATDDGTPAHSTPGAPAPTVAPDDTAYAVAVVAAGNYLAHYGIRDDLLPDLARGAGRSDDDDRAAEVLLAQLWHERSLAPGAAQRWAATTIDELASDFPKWLDDAREELDTTLTDVVGSITQELIHGKWPTKLPSDRTMAELLAHQLRITEALGEIRDKTTTTHEDLTAIFEGLKESIGSQRLGADPATEADARAALDQAYRDIRDEVGQLRVSWSDELSTMMVALVDELQAVKAVGSAADAATRDAQRELVAEARRAAIQSTSTPIDRIAADVSDLADADRELAARVDALADADTKVSEGLGHLADADRDLAKNVSDLTEADREFADALRDLELLVARDITHSRHYILTFDSERGPVAKLLDVLTTHPDFDYNFKHYTANARYGTMPVGMKFDEFHARLTADVSRVFANRHTLVPGYEWGDDHDLSRIEVTLLLYATALRKNIFSEEPWWRTEGSTAELP